MSFSIIVPFRSSDPHRKRAFEYVLNHLNDSHPNAELVVVDDGREGTFSSAIAFDRGVARASHDILVLNDADSFVAAHQLEAAVLTARVQHGIAFAFDRACWLDAVQTENLYGMHEIMVAANTLTKGGVRAVSRETYQRVGGHDHRFVEWGGEDSAFVVACETIAGSPSCITGPLLHLWHPPLGPTPVDPDVSSRDTIGWKALATRYIAARGNPHAMRSIIDEGTRA